MTLFSSTFPNPRVNATFTSYLNDMERATDLTSLDLLHGRSGAYLAAVHDLNAVSSEDLRGALLMLDQLYQAEFRRLGQLGIL